MPMAFTRLDVHDITDIDLTLFMLRCHHGGAPPLSVTAARLKSLNNEDNALGWTGWRERGRMMHLN